MKQFPASCPVCHEPMQIAALRCTGCGTELNGAFSLSPFDQLNDPQYHFLTEFLRCRGNLKEVQGRLHISYPTAKRQLDELLAALELAELPAKATENEVNDMASLHIDPTSIRASDMILAKLKEHGGQATVYTIQHLPCQIWVSADGTKLVSDKLPPSLYGFDVFDCIVELLLHNGGSARKGNGRNFKLGQPNCDDSTVVGYVARHYRGQSDGDSVFDPVFVFAAVLEWAGIVHNGRGELTLTADYLEKLQQG